MDWLRSLLLIFYSPARGMAAARDRAQLGPAFALALVAQSALLTYAFWPYASGGGPSGTSGSAGLFILPSIAWKVLGGLLFAGVVFVPVLIFVANVMERRGSFGVALQQEFAPVASVVFYARAAAALLALVLVALTRVSGAEAGLYAEMQMIFEQSALRGGATAEEIRSVANPLLWPEILAWMLMLPSQIALLVVAVRAAFGFSWGRAALAVLAADVIMVPLTFVLWPLFSFVAASPLLIIIFFLLARGYLGEAMRGQRARSAFRQNLEAATLNPADASAHYNLGLIHLQRKELDEARARFERAVEIDSEETDAHYQLGRIAREQGRLAEAINHFGQVVSRDEAHAQHEVWREVGATYLAAGQFNDARDALGRFLDRRPSDPEALYLMGRVQFGLGDLNAAKEWMQRCVEAVRTAPAYKYRSDKRWLNEAQQFLRTQA
jgi:tetratricopeptide (TPR) repeat protein